MTKAQREKEVKKFRKKYHIVEDKTMPSYANHPYFVKQAAAAKALLDRVGLPPGWDVKK